MLSGMLAANNGHTMNTLVYLKTKWTHMHTPQNLHADFPVCKRLLAHLSSSPTPQNSHCTLSWPTRASVSASAMSCTVLSKLKATKGKATCFFLFVCLFVPPPTPVFGTSMHACSCCSTCKVCSVLCVCKVCVCSEFLCVCFLLVVLVAAQSVNVFLMWLHNQSLIEPLERSMTS